MRLKSAIIAATAAALLAAPADAAGRFKNGSFEHELTGWTADEEQVFIVPFANHFDEFGAPDRSYDPIDGYYTAMLQANVTDEAVVLSQTFTTVGGLFSGNAAFLGEDYLPWDDSGYVRIYQLSDDSELATFNLADNPTELFFANITGVGDWGSTDWTRFSLRLGAGTYRVDVGVIDRNDDREPSILLVDAFAMSVPEPATWAMMIGGFFGLGAMLRRRRAVPA